MRWIAFLFFSSLLAWGSLGCSSGGGNHDAGTDAGTDAGMDGGDDAGTDAGPDGGDAAADIDLVDDFGLWVPPGQQACSLTWIHFLEMEATFDLACRVTPQPGMVRLPRDGADLEIEWIEKLEIGPAALDATPTSAGAFTHSLQGDENNGTHSYTYTQQFEAGGESVEVSFEARFEVEGGIVSEQVVSLDEHALAYRLFSFRATFNDGTSSVDSCTFEEYPCVTHRFEIEGGDVFQIEQCNFCPPEWICKATPGGLARARFVHDGQTRDVDDPFCLAHSMRHHDWGADHLVRFNDPVDGIHAVYLGSGDYPDHGEYTTIYYLDENYETIETRDVLSHGSGSW